MTGRPAIALPQLIRTPDQRLRVYISSAFDEMQAETEQACQAVRALRMTPVVFEGGARPHPPRDLYHAYIQQSHVFIGIYGAEYGWVAPGLGISTLEDEYRMAAAMPRLIYIREAPARDSRLAALLDDIRRDAAVAYKYFADAGTLSAAIEDDLSLVLSESFLRPVASKPRLAASPPLPLPPTDLIGREKELVDIVRRIGDTPCQVTITGPGGCGKTRLALEAAHSVQQQFADGVWWLDLASAAEADLVPAVVAHGLGLREADASLTLVDSIRNFLQHKQSLLVLDNFEQVVAAAPVIQNMTQGCEGVALLVTSRTPLHLIEEQLVVLAPLTSPDPRRLPPLEKLGEYPAVQLFVRRAQEVRPDFDLTSSNAADVATICRRLDGLPLAIELAAARVKVLQPSALLERLRRRMDVLRSGARDLPERQKTMESAIDWSYHLLDLRSRILLRRLSLFPGGASLEAVDEVCNFDAALGEDTLEELGALDDLSLLVRGETAQGEARFEMLNTVREFALQRLEESGEAPLARSHQVAFFTRLAEEAEVHMRGAERRGWLDKMSREHANWRACLRSAVRPGAHAEPALRLVAPLAWYWFFLGRQSEGREWTQSALAMLREAPDPQPLPARLLARAYYGAGGLAAAQGDYRPAASFFASSVEHFRQSQDQGGLGLALVFAGLTHVITEGPPVALPLYQEGLEAARAINDRWTEGFALTWMGEAHLEAGSKDEARRHLEAGLALWRELDDPWGLSLLVHILGNMHVIEGDFASAKALYAEGTALMRAVGDKWGIARSLVGYGDACARLGEREAARDAARESLAMWREMGNPRGLYHCLIALAALATETGSAADGARLFGAAEALSPGPGLLLYTVDRVRRTHALETVSAALAQEEYERLRAEGAAMTIDEVSLLVDRLKEQHV
jgi:predicted ATPase